MEIILLEKIDNLGAMGDKVNVKPGYGRNFLIPQGKAKVPGGISGRVLRITAGHFCRTGDAGNYADRPDNGWFSQ